VRRARTLLAVSLLSLVAACGGTEEPAQLTGTELDPPFEVSSTPLVDTDGAAYSLTEDTDKDLTLVFFGYTNCPDICGQVMATLAGTLTRLDEAQKDRLDVVFVTTDPKRDTPAVLRRWLDQFSTSFVGLLGTPAEIARAETAAGVAVAAPGPPVPTVSGHPDEHPTEPGAPITHKHFGPLGYSVTHSAVILAYDADDRLPVLYPGGVTVSDIAQDLPLLIDPARASR
jgi:protein SCO1/2